MDSVKKTSAPAKKTAAASKPVKSFAVDKKNYKYIALGLGVMVVGFLLMLGGGSSDPNVFDGSKLFSFTRITLSTILVVAGFVIEIYAIMKKPKTRE
jgi:hypothetical protein